MTATDRRLAVLLTLGLFGLFAVSALLGRVPLPLSAAFGDIWQGKPSPAALILVELRLPRALLGVLVGASLGLAGAAMQGLLRNPLAEPGVMGVSGLAAFGAVVAWGVFIDLL